MFESQTLSEGFFVGGNRVNCAAPFWDVDPRAPPGAPGVRRIVYGTDEGVYLSDLGAPERDPVRVLTLMDVTQVDVLERYQLLIVLSGASRSPLPCRSNSHSW